MNHAAGSVLLAAILLFPLATPAGGGSSSSGRSPRPFLRLVPTGTYDTGLGANGAEIVSVRQKDAVAAVTNIRAATCGADTGAVDLLDLARPAQPALLRRVCILPSQTTTGAPNSVAVHPTQDYFLVVVGTAGAQGVVAAYRISDGVFLASSPTGIQPDSVAISPNGRFAVVANEAEGTGVGADGGPGSLTVVDLWKFKAGHVSVLPVTQVALPSLAGTPGFSTGRTDDIARLPVDNGPGSLEPETVAWSPDSRFAYVTLQENSGVVRLDPVTGETSFFGTGQTSHLADTIVDGVYAPATLLTSFRESDGIAVDPAGKFFVTADEGDTRNGTGSSGPRGGRTVSVFDARTGALLGDTGSQLDDWSDLAGLYPDSRSNRGGSEPEVLDITQWKGRTLVAVGLERSNAVALIDVTEEDSPTVIDIEKVGTAPEGVKFFNRRGDLFIATANEGDGTVSILQVLLQSSANAAQFAVFSDPHVYDVAALGAATPEFQAYLAQDRKMLVESEEILDAALAGISAAAPDFLVIPGDLTKDGEKVNHKLLAKKLSALQESGIRVFVVPGNHDIENPHAIDFRTSPPVPTARVTPREFARIYRDFGYEDAISRDPASLSYLAEPVPGIWLFALDSARYESNIAQDEPVTAGALRPQTLAWATHWLGEARRRGKIAIGTMHHGLIEHFAGQAQQFPEYLVADREAVGDALAAAGLRLVFTGHFHANDVASRPTPSGTQYDVETGSLVTAPSPYRLVKADLSARRFAISSSRVTAIPSHPADFVPYSTGFLVNGLSGITMAQLTSPPFNLPAATAAQIAPLVVGGLVAHYAGDEVAPAAVAQAIAAMIGSSDPATQALGFSLFGLWNDPAPTDGTVTVNLQAP